MPEPMRIVGDGSCYVGKQLVVGMVYKTKTGKVLRREQYYGRIIKADERGIIVERADTGQQVSLPPILQQAEPGHYRLQPGGEVVVDPDYFAQWACKGEPDRAIRRDL